MRALGLILGATLALAHRSCNERKGDKPLGKVWRKQRSGPLPDPVKAVRS